MPLRAARAALRRTGRVAADTTTTVSAWLREHGQSDRLTEWLWEPLAVAALNQSPDEAAAEPFVRVLAEMFGPDADASALVLPNRPLHLMYAEPARTFITNRGGVVCQSTPARIVVENARVAGVDVRGERVDAGAVVCCRSLVRDAECIWRLGARRRSPISWPAPARWRRSRS